MILAEETNSRFETGSQWCQGQRQEVDRLLCRVLYSWQVGRPGTSRLGSKWQALTFYPVDMYTHTHLPPRSERLQPDHRTQVKNPLPVKAAL